MICSAESPAAFRTTKYSEAMVAFGQDKVWDEATLRSSSTTRKE